MSFVHADYTVAWICALPLEMAAAKAMLDEFHTSLSQPRTDHNVYTLGAISNHNVVVVCLPFGVYGTISASTAVSHMVSTYPNIQFGLLVGIGGGVARELADIRLGDIVVSKPTTTSPGVIQYDYGKTLREGKLQRTGLLNKPPQVLLKAVSQINSDYLTVKRRVSDVVAQALQKHAEDSEQFARPETDWLFNSTYDHEEKEPDCSACDLRHLVHRPPRTTDEPYIHYGLIASGDQVMKDAKTRDSIAQELDVLCFEMEAAGVMDELPSLVIRGICDYCDSHKHKQWQGYAALTAAAYAKSLLSTVPTVINNRQPQKVRFTTDEEACLQSLFLTDPADDKNLLRRRKGGRADGTCEWILETDEIINWLEASEPGGQTGSEVLWLHGNPGTGKSMMAMALTDEIPKLPSFADGTKVLAYFFCDSSNEKQRTAVSILRGLIHYLVTQCPSLVKFILPKYTERKESLYTSFDALWAILMEMGQDCAVEIYCIIDALDECESDSQQDFIRQVYHSFQGQRTTDSLPSHLHLLITSRPYFEISEYLSYFRNRDLASYSAVGTDLKVMIQEKVKDLAERKKYSESVTQEVCRILEAKAEGTFLWVGIACGELSRPEVRSRNAIRTLGGMPPGLYALYQQLLNKALVKSDCHNDEKEYLIEMMRFVAFARRPLTVVELTALCQLYPDDDEASRLLFTKELIDLCRLMIVIQDGHVQLLHKSVKDFIVKEQLGINELRTHADMANRCIDLMLDCVGIDRDRKIAFLEYAVEYWPEHAGHADTIFVIGQRQESFFQPKSRIWEKWIEWYNAMRKFDEEQLGEGFCVLHAAARWGIPTIIWGLGTTAGNTECLHSDQRTYNDAEFGTKDGLTPLEEAARQGHMSIMSILLKRIQVGLKVSKRVVEAAARNGKNGKDIMAHLLDQQGDQIQITEDVVEAAAGNRHSGKDIMTLLLNRQGDRIQITEDVVKTAARNWHNGKDIMTLLLDRREDRIQITEDVVEAAAGNRKTGKDIITLLLDQQGDQIQITEDVVKAAASNMESGKDIMTLLLDQREDRIQITEDVVKTAARNWHNGKDIMTLLLDRRGDQIQITEDVIKAAAGNKYNGKDIMTLLLDRQGDQIQITEDVVKTAARNRYSGKDIMTLLLDRQGDQIQITEDVVKAAAGNIYNGKDTMKLLLDRRGDQIQITEDVIKAAAGNWYSGKDIMTLLLDRQGDQIQLTEDMIKAVVGNS